MTMKHTCFNYDYMYNIGLSLVHFLSKEYVNDVLKKLLVLKYTGFILQLYNSKL